MDQQGFIQNPGKGGITTPPTPKESWPRKLISSTKSVLVCRRPQITLRGLKISKFFWGSMPPHPPRRLRPMAAADLLSRTQTFPPLYALCRMQRFCKKTCDYMSEEPCPSSKYLKANIICGYYFQ